MNYQQAVSYILEIPKFTKKNDLEHTKELLVRLGSPQQDRKIIHVAGTNGKGSVCAYLQSLLMSEGIKTGMFTSPHLVSINERIRFSGIPILDQKFLEAFRQVKQVVDQMTVDGYPHPTFFEFLFGMGMVAFAEASVTHIILETGLGGTYDATNSIDRPFLTMITSIGLDHMEVLGDTISEIAGEKAGIIKPGIPLIFDANNPESAEVIRNRAGSLQAPCREITKNAYEIKEIQDKYIAFSCLNAYYGDITWKVQGSGVYQVDNVMIALEAFLYVNSQNNGNRQASKESLSRWQQAVWNVRWDSRMEEIRPKVILDGAHNEGAIAAFVESVRLSTKRQEQRTVILFSASKDKRYERMIYRLCAGVEADVFVVTSIQNERRVPARELGAVFKKYTKSKVIIEEKPEEAFKRAMTEKGDEGRLYCLGSLYLTGMIKTIVEEIYTHVEL